MLFVLAFDHRNSFRTEFLGLTGPETAEHRRQARAAKQVALDGLLAALPLPAGRPGILLDDEYGAQAAARAAGSGVEVGMPVERSGQVELAFQHEPFHLWLDRLRPAWAKVLVRYNPAGPADRNARQRARLRLVQDWCAAHGTGFMLELLVPPEPGQLAGDGRDARPAYDRALRPGLTVAAIRELADAGIAPRLWKLEGMDSGADYAAVAAAVRSAADPAAGCVVLGRGADPGSVRRWLALAAPVDGFVGFAVGRTLWWDALRGHLAGELSRADAVDRIATGYRELVSHYLSASGSTAQE